MDNVLASFDAGLLQMMIRSATPVALAALGGLLTEHAGIMNIGMEGMMLLGAFFAVVGSYFFASAAMGVLLAVLVGILIGLLFALFVVKFQSDEFIIGVALNIFASGLTIYLLSAVFGESAAFGNDAVLKIARVELDGATAWTAAHAELVSGIGTILLSAVLLAVSAWKRAWKQPVRVGIGATVALVGVVLFGRIGIPFGMLLVCILIDALFGRSTKGATSVSERKQAGWSVCMGGMLVFLLVGAFRCFGVSWQGLFHLTKVQTFFESVPYLIVSLLDGFSILVYVTWVLVAAMYLFVYRTPVGYWIRAAGEHPESLRTAGQSPERMKWLASILCGALCGLAGAYLSIADLHQFSRGMSAGRGYVAFACVIFGSANPPLVFVASLLFGFLDALGLRMQETVNPHLTKMAPYLITVVAMVLVVRIRAVRQRRLAKRQSIR